MHDASRLHTLVSILIRYGFGDVVRRMGLLRAVSEARKVLPLAHLEELVALPPQVRVRRALEEMGPCFVKLGQVLATRVDVFPPEWIAEFGRLQNAVPSVPFDAIRSEMLDALGHPLDSVFLAIDPAPLAAASIAQVHRARWQRSRGQGSPAGHSSADRGGSAPAAVRRREGRVAISGSPALPSDRGGA